MIEPPSQNQLPDGVETHRLAVSEAELPSIHPFRYEVYVEGMGRPREPADKKRRMVRDALDGSGLNVVCVRGDSVAGIVRVSILGEAELRRLSLANRDHQGVLSAWI